MNCLQYHSATKYAPESIRNTVPPLDWENRPDPFRHYESTPLIDLPADPVSPPVTAISVLRGELGPASEEENPIPFLSQLLFYSASISAMKQTPSGYGYALRVNPSSGNLHPTEFHFASSQGLFHYRPSSHMLEQRAIGHFGALSFVLTTISWREAWKYGDRAYRYCLLDAGHAWQALELSARALGCEAQTVGCFADDEIVSEYGLPDDEWPLLLVRFKRALKVPSAQDREWIGGIPNKLSNEMIHYPAIASVHSSTKLLAESRNPLASHCPPFPALFGCNDHGASFGDVVRRRRSALDFCGGAQTMSAEQLFTLLEAGTRALTTDFLAHSYVNLYAYVHRVDGLDPGLYRHLRESNGLELLKAGDQRVIAAGLSLGQNLAGNSCVTFSMVADLPRAMADAGDWGYRYVHFEAGAIGQRLYVCAEALGLQATGMGAFYDDLVHEYLGLRSEQGQVVYHFACGYAVEDRRLVPTIDDVGSKQ